MNEVVWKAVRDASIILSLGMGMGLCLWLIFFAERANIARYWGIIGLIVLSLGWLLFNYYVGFFDDLVYDTENTNSNQRKEEDGE